MRSGLVSVSNPHLIVVEDDPAISHILRALLNYGGMTCEVVPSPMEALRRLSKDPFTAVIVDLGLPKPEGYDFIRTLRAYHRMPIIIIFAEGADQDKTNALDAGADDVVWKPFFPGELLARIRRLC